MAGLRNLALFGAAAVALVSCATPTLDDPYPGNGGSLFHAPTNDDIADTRLIFDAGNLSHFRPGTTTKRDIVAALGKPTWWTTSDNGTSRLGYDFLLKGSTTDIPAIAPAVFVFDSKNILVDLSYADSYKYFHIEHGPESFACVKALVGPQSMFLGGVVPKNWGCGPPRDGEECLMVGGYIRTPIHVQRVVVGKTSHRDLVIEFTVTSAREGRWPAYFLLATDRFGTTRVATWDTNAEACKHSVPDAGHSETIPTK